MACAEALQAHAHAIPNSKTNRPLFQIPFFLCFLHQFLHNRVTPFSPFSLL